MFNFVLILLTLLITPRTQVVNVQQAENALGVSVLVRAKQYVLDPETHRIRHGMAGCSGTFVSGDQVLTAAHCFGTPTTDIWVRGSDFHFSYRATLVKADPEHDLALLHIEHLQNHPYARIGKTVRTGEQVVNVGSPLSFEFLVSEGIVAAKGFKVRQFTSTYIVTTAMINPGSSGGGAFNAAGELIGVNTLSVGMFGWTGISLAVSSDDIKEFLNGSI